MIDPWLKNNPTCPPGFKAVDRCDLLFLTHAHRDHRRTPSGWPSAAAKAVRLLNVREVVPTHFGGFDFLTGRPSELRDLTRDRGVTVYDLQPGETLRL